MGFTSPFFTASLIHGARKNANARQKKTRKVLIELGNGISIELELKNIIISLWRRRGRGGGGGGGEEGGGL